MSSFTPLRALSDPDALVSNAVNALAGQFSIAQVDAAQLPAKVVAAPEPKVEATSRSPLSTPPCALSLQTPPTNGLRRTLTPFASCSGLRRSKATT